MTPRQAFTRRLLRLACLKRGVTAEDLKHMPGVLRGQSLWPPELATFAQQPCKPSKTAVATPGPST
jgi:hypothetical protein